jgi:hypothetical protein
MRQVSDYADDANLLQDDIGKLTKMTENLVESSEEVCLDENTEKTKYMLVSRRQNAARNNKEKIANRSFEIVTQFGYLETTVINQNWFLGEIKRRFNSSNSCYHSVHNVSFFLV